MSSLDEYYDKLNTSVTEGNCKALPKQISLFKQLIKENNIVNIMEIGFNGGHSSEMFLSTNANIKVTSFDIGLHEYVNIGKKYIDDTYPNRHVLIIGNSKKSVPAFINKTNQKFDLIFIDGGHEYKIARADLLNCKKLAHKDTIVIMDDTINTKEWIKGHNYGPNYAWKLGLDNKIVTQLGTEDYYPGRGCTWGKYIL